MCIVYEDGKLYWSASHWGMHELPRDEHANTVGRLKAEIKACLNMRRENNNFFNAFKRLQDNPAICRNVTAIICKVLSGANVS